MHCTQLLWQCLVEALHRCHVACELTVMGP